MCFAVTTVPTTGMPAVTWNDARCTILLGVTIVKIFSLNSLAGCTTPLLLGDCEMNRFERLSGHTPGLWRKELEVVYPVVSTKVSEGLFEVVEYGAPEANGKPTGWIFSGDGSGSTPDTMVVGYNGCGSHEAEWKNPIDFDLAIEAPSLLADLKASVCLLEEASGVVPTSLRQRIDAFIEGVKL